MSEKKIVTKKSATYCSCEWKDEHEDGHEFLFAIPKRLRGSVGEGDTVIVRGLDGVERFAIVCWLTDVCQYKPETVSLVVDKVEVKKADKEEKKRRRALGLAKRNRLIMRQLEEIAADEQKMAGYKKLAKKNKKARKLLKKLA